MEKLSAFEEKILEILLKLEYLCDVVSTYKHDTKKGIIYSFGDMIPPAKGQEELEYIVSYLNHNGLDISITFDINNSDPNESIYLTEYHEASNVPLGLIKGKNIEGVKKIVSRNINQLKDKTINKKTKDSKHITMSEDIELKTLDIVISNGYITYRKNKSKKMNFTDKELIRFLYCEFIKEQQTCFSKKVLSEEVGTSEGYIKNRISFINQQIRGLIFKGKSSIDDFIKYEPRRGYRLNPRFVIQFPKKE